MDSGAEVMQNLLDALLPNRAAPALARVIKSREGPGKTAYSVDVRVVTAGTHEETEQIIAEVPISPIWIGKRGAGLYAIPPEDALVIVEFIGWNPAYPYISGVWSDEYEAGEFSKGQFVITDGEGVRLGVDVDALIMFETANQSLKEILDTLINEITAIQTQGSPSQHVISPVSMQKLSAIKTKIAQLLK